MTLQWEAAESSEAGVIFIFLKDYSLIYVDWSAEGQVESKEVIKEDQVSNNGGLD